MDIKGFNVRMQIVKDCLSKCMSEEALKKAGDKVFVEYLEGKDEIPRKQVEEFLAYTNFHAVTVADLVSEEYTRTYREAQHTVKMCEEYGMIFTGKEGYGLVIVPLEIYWEKAENFLELLSSGEIKTENDRYRLFKSWLFSYGVSSYVDDGKVIPFIPTKTLFDIKNFVPQFWKRVRAEGKAYYEKEGYYEARKAVREGSTKRFQRISSLSQEKRNKIVFIEKDGKRIKVAD